MRPIDADALLNKVQDYGEGQEKLMLIDPYWVRNAPTVEPKHGEWGEVFEHLGVKYHKCMACYTGIKVDLDHQKYCPECGARMKEGENK